MIFVLRRLSPGAHAFIALNLLGLVLGLSLLLIELGLL